MKKLRLPRAWMQAVAVPAIIAFRARARDVLDRDVLQAVCPACNRVAPLVLDGFGNDGHIGLICLECCTNLFLRSDNHIYSHVSGLRNTVYYCNLIKDNLTKKGIDWQTGHSLPKPS